MKYYDSTGKVELTKANAIFVKDYDGHSIAIHEHDLNLFNEMCEKSYSKDDFEEFEKLFPNMCGGDPHLWREQNLK